MSWLFIRKLIRLHRGKTKFTYKEEHKLVFILIFPVAIRQSKKSSDLPDLPSVPELPTKDSKLLPANKTLLAMETPLPEHREKRRNGRSLILVEIHKGLRNYLMWILMPDYEVISVCGAKTAFTTICEQHPDATLASSALVRISGEELTVRIKSDGRVAHVPVMLPVKPNEDSKEIQRNADLYVTMPFAISFLKTEIESLATNREIIRERYIRLTSEVDAPDDVEADAPLSDGDQKFISLVRSPIEERPTDSRFTIGELSDCVSMSHSNSYGRIKEIADHTPTGYVRNIRLNKALVLLMSRKYTVAGVADVTGFSDPKYFRIVSKKRSGDSPTEYISSL